jgi:CrcB protein
MIWSVLSVAAIGGFTTFSAFSVEIVQLIEKSDWSGALLYAALSVALSVGACFAGVFGWRAVVA